MLCIRCEQSIVVPQYPTCYLPYDEQIVERKRESVSLGDVDERSSLLVFAR